MAKYKCDWCDHKTDRLNDKLTHFTQVHLNDPNTDMRRTVSCWACAAQIHPDAEACGSCGWVRIEQHKKGTQHCEVTA
jgi:hypothetical protein